VDFPEIAAVSAGLARAELGFAACGSRVRTITACRGGSCRYGLIDPQALARRLHERVASRADLPHKFKIGLTGCPNSCIKPQENDLGIMGVACLAYDAGLCGLCGLCVDACRVGALAIEGDQLVCDTDKCLNCGLCASVCPTGAWELTGTAYALVVGGNIGRIPRLADRLPLKVADAEALLEVVDAVLDWYIEHGRQRERFGDTIDRVRLEALLAALPA
jgi:dissimilatory sulfite reductase (desulfoviridin) alpha/beta subunit